MASLFALILLIDLAVIVVALFECLSAPETAIRGLPRLGWVFAVLLLGPVGALAWFLFGRPAPEFRIANPAVPARVATARPLGPDDDPDFLRGLAEAIKAQER